MTAQKGKDLLLKLDSDGEGSFVTVAGLRSRAIAFKARAGGVTHAGSAGRRRDPRMAGGDPRFRHRVGPVPDHRTGIFRRP